MSKKKNKNACCECCSYCVPIGEGDHICDAKGVWYCDGILKYLRHKVQSFTWEVGKNVIINLKEDGK